MKTPNYSGTADYFERRAAKAAGERRRAHLAAIAKLYREKAQDTGMSGGRNMDEASAPPRRERVAAMFRAFGDPSSIARSRRRRALEGSEIA